MMSECHFWWRAGDVQWCDMVGELCQCSGLDERCDMKRRESQAVKAKLLAKARSTREDEEDE